MPTTESLPVSVNGETRLVNDDAILPDVLRAFGIDDAAARGVAVAVNDELVRRNDWATRRLEAGDRIEIVTARQGG